MDIFSRNVPGTTERLQRACVGIAGCGGLGSNAAVLLARAGIGKLILADFDVVEPSNLNRQHFFMSDIGNVKAEALGSHLRAINPDIQLGIFPSELTPDTVGPVFGEADILVEAFDRAESKSWLIHRWCRQFPEKPVIAGNGVSGYGASGTLRVEQVGNMVFCGDMSTDMSIGLAAPRIMIVAAMQANAVIELLLEGRVS